MLLSGMPAITKTCNPITIERNLFRGYHIL